MVNYEETEFGFDYGSAKITRTCSDEKMGWVILSVETPKQNLQLYVTKSGKVRVFSQSGGEWSSDK